MGVSQEASGTGRAQRARNTHTVTQVGESPDLSQLVKAVNAQLVPRALLCRESPGLTVHWKLRVPTSPAYTTVRGKRSFSTQAQHWHEEEGGRTIKDAQGCK